jgi:predicted DsbA family dithiol-disulfide isomerase
VGKKNLETAFQTYKPSGSSDSTPAVSESDVEIVWEPYQLRPSAPPEGIPKPPDTPSNPRVGARMKAAGLNVGIDFTGKTDRSPNTLLAHMLSDYVLEKYGWKKQNELQERMFKGYFTDGIYPDVNALAYMGRDCGLDEKEVREALADDGLRYKVTNMISQNNEAVLGGVPMFIMNGRPAFSGARDPSAFHVVFDVLLGHRREMR